MARPTDELRVLRALDESDGMSNSRLRTELNLSDGKYQEIRNDLLGRNLITKYRCRHGGLKLTSEGEKVVKASEPDKVSSKFKKENELYGPLIKYLEKQAEEDELAALTIDTSSLRKKGKWQNPDVMQIVIEHYAFLQKSSIVIATFEVKKWNSWDIGVVFEAASHRRFSHTASVVLEWPDSSIPFSVSDPTYKIDEIARECQRFGVGLQTLRPHYSSQRIHTHLEPENHTPSDDAIEQWLEYVFSRYENKKEKYFDLIKDL